MLKRFFIARSFGLHISKPKNIPGNIFFDVLKAWDYARTILYREKLQIAYIKAEKIPGNIFFDITKVRKSSRRGLFGG